MEELRDIVYQTSSVTVQQLQKGNNNVAVIVDNGYSFSVDENNNVTFTNHPQKIRGYRNCTIFVIYTQTCEELEVTESELAKFINKEFMLYKRVILHGYAKYGLRFLRLYHEQLNTCLKPKTHVFSISAPINEINLKSILEDGYKNNIHIVVSKPSDNPLSLIFQLIRGYDMVPFKDQIPDFIYDSITASNAETAMRKSCKFVRALM